MMKRRKATAAEMVERKQALYQIIAENRPMTVRQVFYQAVVRGLEENSLRGYERVQVTLVKMRKNDELPYAWLTDSSRSVYRINSFETPEQAVRSTAYFYRKALWADAEERVEIWLEKDALSGVLLPITREYDVGLYVARGFASLSYLHAAAEEINDSYPYQPTVIYHLGDYDPSGMLIGETIEDTLNELVDDPDSFRFIRLAVNPDQIAEWNLPSQPTKQSSHNHGWTGASVELDAIPPGLLRVLVIEAIEQHLPAEQFEKLKAAEASERAFLQQWSREGFDGDG